MLVGFFYALAMCSTFSPPQPFMARRMSASEVRNVATPIYWGNVLLNLNMMGTKFEPLPGSVNVNEISPKNIRRVLGIDPGLANTGFGIVDFVNGRYRMVSYGCITTNANEPHGERLMKIYSNLCAVIDEFKPTEAGMETLYFAKNVTSAMSVAEARGVVTLCLAQHGIKLGEYQPNQIKQAVTGSTRADKKLVQSYVKLLLGLEVQPKPDHAADALAGAITHIHNVMN